MRLWRTGRETGRETKLSAHIGDYEMDHIILDLESEANALTKKTCELMGKSKLQWSPIKLKM